MDLDQSENASMVHKASAQFSASFVSGDTSTAPGGGQSPAPSGDEETPRALAKIRGDGGAPSNYLPIGERKRRDELLRYAVLKLRMTMGQCWELSRTWPWARVGWAYGFTLLGAASTVGVALLLSAVIASSRPAKAPTVHVETSQRFRPIQ